MRGFGLRDLRLCEMGKKDDVNPRERDDDDDDECIVNGRSYWVEIGA